MTRARIAARSAEQIEPTDALLAGKVQRKVSNGIAGLAAAGLAGGPPKSAQIGPIRRIRLSRRAGSGNESVISALCLRGPFLVSRFRAMRLQREKQQ